MEFSVFLQNFYLPDDGGGLVGYKSKKRIPMFFFEHGLVEGHDNAILQPSDSTFEKWETGSRKPESMLWAEVLKCFDDGKLQKGLLNTLNENNLRTVMERFGITFDADELPDKLLFAKAVAVQFHAIASGNGSAANIVPTEYRKPPELKGFNTYLREAIKNYKLIKLPGNVEGQLNKFFVCNNIGKTSVAFPYKTKEEDLKDATLPTIRTFDRYTEIRYAILIGACGYGKTLMLQHLFLDAAERMHKTGLLPVFAELRDFSSRYSDIVSFLSAAVQRFDKNFSQEKLIDLLGKGQTQILLDGLDEMNPEETNAFQRRLGDFCHHYPNNQVVISSRQCSAINGIRGFVPLYIRPLDEEQAQKLIDKLLYGVKDKNAKETILSFMDKKSGYIKKNSFIATNPMLLTIMAQHYEDIQNLNGSKIKFYDLLYDTIIRGHDKDKESFYRFFHSVGSGDEFTEVFREFCALAYMDGVYKFDRRSFEKYFRQLKTKEKLQNPSIFSISNFQHDACATACMMYEQKSDIFYIDEGFQDYFFAGFYYLEDAKTTKVMGRALWKREFDSFRNLDALKMFYEIAKEKTEVCLLQPLLDSIFKGKSEEEAFLLYLSYGFGDITYFLYDRAKIIRFMKDRAEQCNLVSQQNHTKNIVLGLLCDILDLPNEFEISSTDKLAQPNELTTHFIAAYYDNFKYPGDEGELWHTLLMTKIFKIEFKNQHFQKLGFTPFPIFDKKTNQATIFGYVYKVNPLSLLDKPERQEEFLKICKNGRAWEAYKSVKAFYKEIANKQKSHEYQWQQARGGRSYGSR